MGSSGFSYYRVDVCTSTYWLNRGWCWWLVRRIMDDRYGVVFIEVNQPPADEGLVAVCGSGDQSECQ